jgi:hypothetical protein
LKPQLVVASASGAAAILAERSQTAMQEMSGAGNGVKRLINRNVLVIFPRFGQSSFQAEIL